MAQAGAGRRPGRVLEGLWVPWEGPEVDSEGPSQPGWAQDDARGAPRWHRMVLGCVLGGSWGVVGESWVAMGWSWGAPGEALGQPGRAWGVS